MASQLFNSADEIAFKRQYVISFLAAYDVAHFAANCGRGWKSHKPPVEDAQALADSAWSEWCRTIGSGGSGGDPYGRSQASR